MPDLIERHRRYLPHCQEASRIFSITWRLEGDLPASMIRLISEMKLIYKEMQKETDQELRFDLNKSYKEKLEIYDEMLAKHLSCGIDLSKTEFADLIAEAFHFYDHKLYVLSAFCVMSNHIHLMVRPLELSSGQFAHISTIVKRLKSYTAKQINKLDGRSGAVWRPDYYDRYIRNVDDYRKTAEYILNNPVKARLVRSSEDWAYSFFRWDY